MTKSQEVKYTYVQCKIPVLVFSPDLFHCTKGRGGQQLYARNKLQKMKSYQVSDEMDNESTPLKKRTVSKKKNVRRSLFKLYEKWIVLGLCCLVMASMYYM